MFEKMKTFFKFKERNANFKSEIYGGLVTFLAMSYILVVNPIIVSGTATIEGIPMGAVFMATAISAAIATILMALLANLPISLAPGMGINAFFVNVIIGQMSYTWQEALAASFLAGVIFLLISFTNVRNLLINSIPKSLKSAISVGIGFFIATVGLTNSKIIDISGGVFQMGDFSDPVVILGLVSVIVIILVFVLDGKINKFSFIISIIITTLLGLLLNYGFKLNDPNLPTFNNFDYKSLGEFKDVAFTGVFQGFKTLFTKNILQVFFIIFALLFVDIFDTAGTLIAVTNAANLKDEDGNVLNVEQAFLSDAIGTVVGASLGTPVVTAYVESATGVEAGAKTGFSNLVVAMLFLLSILLFPIFNIFSSPAVTTGSLVLVGILMTMQIKNIDFNNVEDAIYSFVTIIIMLLSGSIANGIAFGFIFYTLIKLVKGEIKMVHPIIYSTTILFVLYYILMATVI